MLSPHRIPKWILRSVAVSVLIVSTIGAAATPAAAQSDSAAPCTATADAQLTATLTTDGNATFTVGNADPLCDPMTIGLALYLKDAWPFYRQDISTVRS